MKHIVLFSGGVGSWAAAKRVAERHGTDDLILLFTDTLIEDEDTYRFLEEAAANVGGEFVRIADGRTPFEVFKDVRFLGNSRIDPCSKYLKRDLADKWIKEHFQPGECIMYIGIDWSEIDRYERLAPRKLPYIYKAPLCHPPFVTRAEMHAWAEREGLRKQRLYEIGMSHANCGGGCVKAGQGHWAKLYKAMPERFAWWEMKEQEIRDMLGDVSMLKQQVNGESAPLALSELRKRLEEDDTQVDMFDIGGCACMVEWGES